MWCVLLCCARGSDPDDLAALLKHFLRNLAEPIIPLWLNDRLQVVSASLQRAVQGQQGGGEAAAATSRLVHLCLELPSHRRKMLQRVVATLAVLAKSRRVKMDAGSLAICLAPCVSRPPCHDPPSVSVAVRLHSPHAAPCELARLGCSSGSTLDPRREAAAPRPSCGTFGSQHACTAQVLMRHAAAVATLLQALISRHMYARSRPLCCQGATSNRLLAARPLPRRALPATPLTGQTGLDH